MIDYKKPILNKRGEPLKILECAAHHCIRCIKKSRAMMKLGYEMHGMGNKVAYGVGDYSSYNVWQSKKQFQNSIKIYKDLGVDLIVWDNEPDEPVSWIKEVVGDDIPIVVDLHDLDSIRRQLIPLQEREMFNHADGLIYVSKPIREITNKLHQVELPNTVVYSYCNDGIVEYDETKIGERRGLVYEGGANPPKDDQMNAIFSYRSLYDIIKKLVEMGNETYMFCGNFSAFESYQNTGASLFPPTDYDKMMEDLVKFKYGILVFNNEDGKKHQVNLTLTNKEEEYLQCGLPSLACWCPESQKHIDKHGTGFTFNHIEEIGDCSSFENKYLEVMNNIKTKRKELVMENFIWRLENLYAEILGVEKKGIPNKIKKINTFEYGKEDIERLLS